MRKILTIILALLIGGAAFGQTKVNKRIMLDNPNKGKKGIYSEETLQRMRESNKRAWDKRKQKIKEESWHRE